MYRNEFINENALRNDLIYLVNDYISESALSEITKRSKLDDDTRSEIASTTKKIKITLISIAALIILIKSVQRYIKKHNSPSLQSGDISIKKKLDKARNEQSTDLGLNELKRFQSIFELNHSELKKIEREEAERISERKKILKEMGNNEDSALYKKVIKELEKESADRIKKLTQQVDKSYKDYLDLNKTVFAQISAYGAPEHIDKYKMIKGTLTNDNN